MTEAMVERTVTIAEHERKIAELESVIANWNENNRVLSPVNADHDLPTAL